LLGKLSNILSGTVVDDDFINNFATETLPSLFDAIKEINELSIRLPTEMTPKKLLKESILLPSDEDTLSWLSDLADTLWREIRGIDNLVIESNNCLHNLLINLTELSNKIVNTKLSEVSEREQLLVLVQKCQLGFLGSIDIISRMPYRFTPI
jgi:hypothetical protein